MCSSAPLHWRNPWTGSSLTPISPAACRPPCTGQPELPAPTLARFRFNYLVASYFDSSNRHRPVLEKCYDMDHVMKVGITSRILESSLSALSCFHWSVNCVHRRPGPFGNLTSASLPSCLVTLATITTTTMPVPSTGSNPCRCQCCVWTPPTMSSPLPTVSSLVHFLCWIVF